MKNFKRNILKTIIGVSCVVLPANKLHAQTIDNYELDTDRIIGGGVSYVIPEQNGIYGVGAHVNYGGASNLYISGTKINAGVRFLLDGGVLRFNSDTHKYRGNIGVKFKFGAGYGGVSLMYIKGATIVLGNPNGVYALDIHGGGLEARIGEYITIYADYIHSTDISESAHVSQDIAKQNNTIQAGIIYTLARKTRIK